MGNYAGTQYALLTSKWPTGALDPAKYIEFTVTATTGCFTLNTLRLIHQFYIRLDAGEPTKTADFVLRSSADNFTANLNSTPSSLTDLSAIGSRDGTPTAWSAGANPGFFGPSHPYTTLTFRLHYYNVNPASSTNTLITDQISIDGAQPATCGAMPVELVSFQGKAAGNRVQLSWETAWERNADYFQVERSQNAAEFGAIGQVKAAGDVTQKQFYGFTDEQPAVGPNYYRLRQVDRDGSVQYSKIIAVTSQPDSPAILVLGNPTEGGRINLQLFNVESAKLHLTDLQGRSISFHLMESAGGSVTIEPSASLTSGMYIIGAANVPGVKIIVK